MNRNSTPERLYGQLMGQSLRELTPEEVAKRAERAEHFDTWFCSFESEISDADECNAFVEFDKRKGEPKGWTQKVITRKTTLHYCPAHST